MWSGAWNKRKLTLQISNRFLASTVGRARDWWSGGCEFKPHWGQFLMKFILCCETSDLSDNLTEMRQTGLSWKTRMSCHVMSCCLKSQTICWRESNKSASYALQRKSISNHFLSVNCGSHQNRCIFKNLGQYEVKSQPIVRPSRSYLWGHAGTIIAQNKACSCQFSSHRPSLVYLMFMFTFAVEHLGIFYGCNMFS